MTKPKRISVGSTVYQVVEDMGYQPSAGYYAKRVRWGKGVRVAVAKSLRGPWRFWTQADVLQFTPPKPVPSRFW